MAFKLKSKLFFIVALPLIGLCLLAYVSVRNLNHVTGEMGSTLYGQCYRANDLVLNADRDMYQGLVGLEVLAYAANGTEDFNNGVEAYRENKDQAIQRVSEAQTLLEDYFQQMPRNTESQRTAEENFRLYKEFINKWSTRSDNLIGELSAGRIKTSAYVTELAEAEKEFDAARSALNEIEDILVAYADGQMKDSQKLTAQSNVSMVIVVIISIIVALLFSYFFIQKITKALKENIGRGIKKMAEGDMTVEFVVDSKDEIGEMAGELNQMREKLAGLIENVADTASRVNSGLNEISVGNQDLSQRTQEQAATLEEVASAVMANVSSIQQTADNSNQADRISQSTLGAVEEGEKSIEEAIDAMGRITESSKQIGEIIKVVNDIAFQTNLLALNAAVEAARAGEQGRGFAVVAAEVRNLAGRTAESSKEIEKLIKESVERVERGNALVKRSGEMLRQIVQNTKRTSDVIIEISAAMREQSASSEQIRTAIDQLNQVTQQNAAMVEEIASSGISLKAEADGLTEIIDVFQVGNRKISRKRSSVRKESERLENLPALRGGDKTMLTGDGFTEDNLERF